MANQPFIIYVSGAPGSGKTTLAQKISQELYIPHISSDLVHGGVRLTEGQPNDRQKSLQNSFVPLMVAMAKLNISFVVDHVLQRNLSEEDIINKLKNHAKIIYIHTFADQSIERHLNRELARKDRGLTLDRQGLIERSEYHRQNLANTQAPLDLAVPTLEVDASDGYRPSFNSVIDFIENTMRGATE